MSKFERGELSPSGRLRPLLSANGRVVGEGAEVQIHEDKLLRASVVVEHDGRLWMVPKSADGWQRRLPLTMTAQAKAERLKPSRRIDAAALGIPVDGPTIPPAAAG